MNRPQRIVIIGAAGQAREIAHYIEDINRVSPTFELAGFVVSDLAKLGAYDSRERVLGDFDWIEAHASDLDGVVLGVGMPATRERLARDLSASFPRLEWPTIVHPGARYDRSTCTLGRGVLFASGAVATVHVHLADFALVNFGSTLGHEARVGRGSVVNPGANVSGGVAIGDRVLIGAGSVVLQYLSVGNDATVGAGAVVTKDVPPGRTVVGVPARLRDA
jgi:sugar O-acyltransferase (sialic acid O-acetyltransferase NeuD family)